MHPDIAVLVELDRIDRIIDDATAQIRRLHAAVKRAEARKAEFEADRAAVQAEDKVLVTEERALQRRLDDYTAKRDKTRKMIDEGKAPDFLAAERQFSQCAEIVDTVEFELLEMMEKREAVAARIAALDEKIALEARRRVDAAARYRAEDPELRARIKNHKPAREETRAGMHRELLSGYDQHRKRGQAPLTRIVDGHCEACHVEPPGQLINEVISGKRSHVCRNCRRWLVEVAHTPAKEDADDPDSA